MPSLPRFSGRSGRIMTTLQSPDRSTDFPYANWAR